MVAVLPVLVVGLLITSSFASNRSPRVGKVDSSDNILHRGKRAPKQYRLEDAGNADNLCEPLDPPTDGRVTCEEDSFSFLCTATCNPGYQFSSGETTYELECAPEDGTWFTENSFPPCRPVCQPECQNGGVCSRPNICSCNLPEFRGPYCQYSTSLCAEPTAPRNGQVQCQHGSTSTECRASCNPGYRPERPAASVYRCAPEGTWNPAVEQIPNCIAEVNIIENTLPPGQPSLPTISTVHPSVSDDATCTAWSQDHYRTFDNKIYTFQGPCTYLLVKDCEYSTFAIHVINDRNCTDAAPCKRELDIYIGSTKITLSSAGIFWNDNRLTIPTARDGVVFESLGSYIQVRYGYSFKLKWDHLETVTVTVSEDMQNRTCGLCGVYDGNPDNDFKAMSGNVVVSPTSFGTSWKMSVFDDQCDDSDQQKTCLMDTPQNRQRSADSNNMCQQLMLGEFRACHAVIDPTPYIEACKIDCCRSDHDECMCSTFQAYSRACLQENVQLSWRNTQRCPMSCPVGMVYKECGSSCARTCGSSSQSCSNDVCIDGCFCPDDMALHNGRCLPIDQCPCTHQGNQYMVSERVKKDECNYCTCQAGKWICSDNDCSAICSATGDPHYQTFDGKRYSFMGICSYFLIWHANYEVIVNNYQCGVGEASCTRSVEINYNGQNVKLGQFHQTLVNGREITQLPYEAHGIKIYFASSLFIKLELSNGLTVMWDGRTRAYVTAPPSFMDETHGLCGTFNNNQNDDFITREGDVEPNVNLFGNKWKTEDSCQDVPSTVSPHPCNLNQQRQSTAVAKCEQLKSDIFAACHNVVNVQTYYDDCLYDICACQGNLVDCMCPNIGEYADACARKGVQIAWRSQITECAIRCTGGQVYQVCGNPCKYSCRNIAINPMCQETCVEGCNCPSGETFDHNGECVPIEQCPCIFDGREYRAGFVALKGDNEICICGGAEWHCTLRSDPRVIRFDTAENLCPENTIYTDCISSCPLTCLNMHSGEACNTTECKPGCMCQPGFVLDGDNCVPAAECPCHHGGHKYYEGEKMKVDCNTCTCQSRKWVCETNECAAVCSSYGDSHHSTFDGRTYEFQGNCDYVLAQTVPTSPVQFMITTENIPCGTSGVTCTKAIDFSIGEPGSVNYFRVQIVRGKPIHLPPNSPFTVEEVGMFIFIRTDLGITLMWDKGTRVYIRIDPSFRSQVQGLCGNFNGNQNDDFTMPQGGPSAIRATTFGDSWRVHDYCAPSREIIDTCSLATHRQAWAQQRCGLIQSAMFEPCHNIVPYEPFLERCIFDACACDLGGDCECLCTAVAAYAHECTVHGLNITWRSQDFCAIQCADCYAYKACVTSCPLPTCEVPQPTCDQEVCVEGCELEACPPGQVYDTHHTPMVCIPEVFCNTTMCTINGHGYLEGERITDSSVCNSYCEICFCHNGQIQRNGFCATPTPTPTTMAVTTEIVTPRITTPRPEITTPQIATPTPETMMPRISTPTATLPSTCLGSGWTSWMSSYIPTVQNRGDVEVYANLRKTYSFCAYLEITAIECRLVGTHTMAAYANQIVQCDIREGFTCLHEKQVNGLCHDYEIRFECDCGETPTPPQRTTPIVTSEITPSFTPSPTPTKQTPSAPAKTTPHTPTPGTSSPTPTSTYATPTKVSYETPTPQSSTTQFSQQGHCLRTGWTEWISTGVPTDEGDLESIPQIRISQGLCSEDQLKFIECRTVGSHIHSAMTGDVGTVCNTRAGFLCYNTLQPDGLCDDYEIRVYCLCTDMVHECDKPITRETPFLDQLDYSYSSLFEGNPDYHPSIARIGSHSFWKPETSDSRPSITLDFGETIEFAGLITQGNPVDAEWMTSYTIEISDEQCRRDSFVFIETPSGRTHVFEANTNQHGERQHMFLNTYFGRCLRLSPVHYHTAPALRFEILGCRHPATPTYTGPSKTPHATPTAFIHTPSTRAPTGSSQTQADEFISTTMAVPPKITTQVPNLQSTQVDENTPIKTTAKTPTGSPGTKSTGAPTTSPTAGSTATPTPTPGTGPSHTPTATPPPGSSPTGGGGGFSTITPPSNTPPAKTTGPTPPSTGSPGPMSTDKPTTGPTSGITETPTFSPPTHSTGDGSTITPPTISPGSSSTTTMAVPTKRTTQVPNQHTTEFAENEGTTKVETPTTPVFTISETSPSVTKQTPPIKTSTVSPGTKSTSAPTTSPSTGSTMSPTPTPGTGPSHTPTATPGPGSSPTGQHDEDFSTITPPANTPPAKTTGQTPPSTGSPGPMSTDKPTTGPTSGITETPTFSPPTHSRGDGSTITPSAISPSGTPGSSSTTTMAVPTKRTTQVPSPQTTEFDVNVRTTEVESRTTQVHTITETSSSVTKQTPPKRTTGPTMVTATPPIGTQPTGGEGEGFSTITPPANSPTAGTIIGSSTSRTPTPSIVTPSRTSFQTVTPTMPVSAVTVPYICREGWSSFMNIDTPGTRRPDEREGPGDYELIPQLHEYFGFCAQPAAIKCRTSGTHQAYHMTGDVNVVCDLAAGGLTCVNSLQPNGICQDFEISVLCVCEPPTPTPTDTGPPFTKPTVTTEKSPSSTSRSSTSTDIVTQYLECNHGWTEFFNVDNPNNPDGGDFETITRLRKYNKFCATTDITDIECFVAGTEIPAIEMGQTYFCNIHEGLICLNDEQVNGICLDYSVRFYCQCEEATPNTPVYTPTYTGPSKTPHATPTVSIHTPSTTSFTSTTMAVPPKITTQVPTPQSTKVDENTPIKTTAKTPTGSPGTRSTVAPTTSPSTESTMTPTPTPGTGPSRTPTATPVPGSSPTQGRHDEDISTITPPSNTPPAKTTGPTPPSTGSPGPVSTDKPTTGPTSGITETPTFSPPTHIIVDGSTITPPTISPSGTPGSSGTTTMAVPTKRTTQVPSPQTTEFAENEGTTKVETPTTQVFTISETSPSVTKQTPPIMTTGSPGTKSTMSPTTSPSTGSTLTPTPTPGTGSSRTPTATPPPGSSPSGQHDEDVSTITPPSNTPPAKTTGPTPPSTGSPGPMSTDKPTTSPTSGTTKVPPFTPPTHSTGDGSTITPPTVSPSGTPGSSGTTTMAVPTKRTTQVPTKVPKDENQGTTEVERRTTQEHTISETSTSFTKQTPPRKTTENLTGTPPSRTTQKPPFTHPSGSSMAPTISPPTQTFTPSLPTAEVKSSTESSTTPVITSTTGIPCDIPMGVANPFIISEEQLMASSSFDYRFEAERVRLNNLPTGDLAGAWMPRTNNRRQWIQADFLSPQNVTGVITQGRPEMGQWVTSFMVEISLDGVTFNPIVDQVSGEAIQFVGNTDQNTPSINFFPVEVAARVVRIHPLDWHNSIALRFDVMSCTGPAVSTSTPAFTPSARTPSIISSSTPSVTPSARTPSITSSSTPSVTPSARAPTRSSTIKETTAATTQPTTREMCTDLMGLENAFIVRDTQMTESSARDLFSGARNARIPNTISAWVPGTMDSNQWILVDLLEPKELTGIITTGSTVEDNWVTEYVILTSIDGFSYTPYSEVIGGRTQHFIANIDRNTPQMNLFSRDVIARYVKIIPTAWSTNGIGLRFNLIGCYEEPLMTSTGTPGTKSTMTPATSSSTMSPTPTPGTGPSRTPTATPEPGSSQTRGDEFTSTTMAVPPKITTQVPTPQNTKFDENTPIKTTAKTPTGSPGTKSTSAPTTSPSTGSTMTPTPTPGTGPSHTPTATPPPGSSPARGHDENVSTITPPANSPSGRTTGSTPPSTASPGPVSTDKPTTSPTSGTTKIPPFTPPTHSIVDGSTITSSAMSTSGTPGSSSTTTMAVPTKRTTQVPSPQTTEFAENEGTTKVETPTTQVFTISETSPSVTKQTPPIRTTGSPGTKSSMSPTTSPSSGSTMSPTPTPGTGPSRTPTATPGPGSSPGEGVYEDVSTITPPANSPSGRTTGSTPPSTASPGPVSTDKPTTSPTAGSTMSPTPTPGTEPSRTPTATPGPGSLPTQGGHDDISTITPPANSPSGRTTGSTPPPTASPGPVSTGKPTTSPTAGSTMSPTPTPGTGPSHTPTATPGPGSSPTQGGHDDISTITPPANSPSGITSSTTMAVPPRITTQVPNKETSSSKPTITSTATPTRQTPTGSPSTTVSSYICVESQWSPLINRNHPTTDIASGDYEVASQEELDKFCVGGRITNIRCTTVDAIEHFSTGEAGLVCDVATGFRCRNVENFPIPCSDFRIQYYCECEATPTAISGTTPSVTPTPTPTSGTTLSATPTPTSGTPSSATPTPTSGTTPLTTPTPTSGTSSSATPTPTSGTPSSATPTSGTPSSATPTSRTPSSATPTSRTPSSATPTSGTPSSATPTPTSRTPSSATPASGTPSSATPTSGTPSSATPTPTSGTPSSATPTSISGTPSLATPTPTSGTPSSATPTPASGTPSSATPTPTIGTPSLATPTPASGTPSSATPTPTSGTPSSATPTPASGTPSSATPTPTSGTLSSATPTPTVPQTPTSPETSVTPTVAQCVRSYWLEWVNRDIPDIGGLEHEVMSPEELRRLCVGGRINKVQCMTVDTRESSQATGEINTCTVANGLICRESDNNGQACYDYTVRYYCDCEETTQTPTPSSSSGPSMTSTASPSVTTASTRSPGTKSTGAPTTSPTAESTMTPTPTPGTGPSRTPTATPGPGSSPRHGDEGFSTITPPSNTPPAKTTGQTPPSTGSPGPVSTDKPTTGPTSGTTKTPTFTPPTHSIDGSTITPPTVSPSGIPGSSSTTTMAVPTKRTTQVPSPQTTEFDVNVRTTEVERRTTQEHTFNETSSSVNTQTPPIKTSTGTPGTKSTMSPTTSPSSGSTMSPTPTPGTGPSRTPTATPPPGSSPGEGVYEDVSTITPPANSPSGRTTGSTPPSTASPGPVSTDKPTTGPTAGSTMSPTPTPGTEPSRTPTATPPPGSSPAGRHDEDLSTITPPANSPSGRTTASTSPSTGSPGPVSTDKPTTGPTSGTTKIPTFTPPMLSTITPSAISRSGTPGSSSTATMAVPTKRTTQVPSPQTTEFDVNVRTTEVERRTTQEHTFSETSSSVNTQTPPIKTSTGSPGTKSTSAPTTSPSTGSTMSPTPTPGTGPSHTPTATPPPGTSPAVAHDEDFSTITPPANSPSATTGSNTPSHVTPTGSNPTVPSLISVKCAWSPWLNTDNPIQEGDLETIRSLRTVHGVCRQIADIECRVAETHISSSATGQSRVSCDINNGLRCYNAEQRNHQCLDYEVRVLCWDTTCEPTPTPSVSVTTPQMEESTTAICVPGQVWETCSYQCRDLCHSMLGEHIERGVCTEGQPERCVAGCNHTSCVPGQRIIDVHGTCVKEEMCTCLKPDGTVAQPYERWPDPTDICTTCSCTDNQITCTQDDYCTSSVIPTPSPSSTTKQPLVSTTTTLMTIHPDCYWTLWINTDRPDGPDGGDLETLERIRTTNVFCENPIRIDCRDVRNQESADQVGQIVTCDVNTGFTCYNRNNIQNCADYEVRFYCPCPETSVTATPPTGTPGTVSTITPSSSTSTMTPTPTPGTGPTRTPTATPEPGSSPTRGDEVFSTITPPSSSPSAKTTGPIPLLTASPAPVSTGAPTTSPTAGSTMTPTPTPGTGPSRTPTVTPLPGSSPTQGGGGFSTITPHANTPPKRTTGPIPPSTGSPGPMSTDKPTTGPTSGITETPTFSPPTHSTGDGSTITPSAISPSGTPGSSSTTTMAVPTKRTTQVPSPQTTEFDVNVQTTEVERRTTQEHTFSETSSSVNTQTPPIKTSTSTPGTKSTMSPTTSPSSGSTMTPTPTPGTGPSHTPTATPEPGSSPTQGDEGLNTITPPSNTPLAKTTGPTPPSTGSPGPMSTDKPTTGPTSGTTETPTFSPPTHSTGDGSTITPPAISPSGTPGSSSTTTMAVPTKRTTQVPSPQTTEFDVNVRTTEVERRTTQEHTFSETSSSVNTQTPPIKTSTGTPGTKSTMSPTTSPSSGSTMSPTPTPGTGPSRTPTATPPPGSSPAGRHDEDFSTITPPANSPSASPSISVVATTSNLFCGWSSWFNSHSPDANGEVETIRRTTISEFCAPEDITAIRCRVAGTSLSYVMAGQTGVVCDLKYNGLMCVNNRQPQGQQCLDYEIQVLCEPNGMICDFTTTSVATPTPTPGTSSPTPSQTSTPSTSARTSPITTSTCTESHWTPLINRNHPTRKPTSGDREFATTVELTNYCVGGMITEIKCVRDGHIPHFSSGEFFLTCDLITGLTCTNEQEFPALCHDFSISYYCECEDTGITTRVPDISTPVGVSTTTQVPDISTPVGGSTTTRVPDISTPVGGSTTTRVPDISTPVGGSTTTRVPDISTPVGGSTTTRVPDISTPVGGSTTTRVPDISTPVGGSTTTRVPDISTPVGGSTTTRVPDISTPVGGSTTTRVPDISTPVGGSTTTRVPDISTPVGGSTTTRVPDISTPVGGSTTTRVPDISTPVGGSTTTRVPDISTPVGGSTTTRVPDISTPVGGSTTTRVPDISTPVGGSTTTRVPDISTPVGGSTTTQVPDISTPVGGSTTKRVPDISTPVGGSTTTRVPDISTPVGGSTTTRVPDISTPVGGSTTTRVPDISTPVGGSTTTRVPDISTPVGGSTTTRVPDISTPVGGSTTTRVPDISTPVGGSTTTRVPDISTPVGGSTTTRVPDISTPIAITTTETACLEPMVGAVPDRIITAFTTFSDYTTALRSRINTTREGPWEGGWIAANTNTQQWIEADFERPIMVTGIATQGVNGQNIHVTSYVIMYSVDGVNYTPYQEITGITRVFQGNSDSNTVVQYILRPITARFVRLQPRTWSGGVGLRWEVFGCSEPSVTATSPETVTPSGTPGSSSSSSTTKMAVPTKGTTQVPNPQNTQMGEENPTTEVESTTTQATFSETSSSVTKQTPPTKTSTGSPGTKSTMSPTTSPSSGSTMRPTATPGTEPSHTPTATPPPDSSPAGGHDEEFSTITPPANSPSGRTTGQTSPSTASPGPVSTGKPTTSPTSGTTKIPPFTPSTHSRGDGSTITPPTISPSGTPGSSGTTTMAVPTKRTTQVPNQHTTEFAENEGTTKVETPTTHVFTISETSPSVTKQTPPIRTTGSPATKSTMSPTTSPSTGSTMTPTPTPGSEPSRTPTATPPPGSSPAEHDEYFSTITPPANSPSVTTKTPTIVTPTSLPNNCTDEMGMANGLITNQMLSGTEPRTPSFDVTQARLNGPSAWIPATDDTSQYVQVDFLEPHILTGVTTQGRPGIPNYVTSYTVQFSYDGFTWSPLYEVPGVIKEFTGNSDSNTPVTNWFLRPIRTRYIRIIPLSRHNQIALRFEVIGCFEPYPTVSTPPPRVSTVIVTTPDTHVRITTSVTTTIDSCIEYGPWVNFGEVDPLTGDYEPIDQVREASVVCAEPMQIECRLAGPARTDYRETGQKVKCNLWDGLVCNNGDQTNEPFCFDYEARVGCLKNIPECLPTPTPTVSVPTPVVPCYEGMDISNCPREGCARGLYCNGMTCVRKSECPCIIDGRVVRADFFTMNSRCESCQCINGQSSCLPKQCPACVEGFAMHLDYSTCQCSCETCAVGEFMCSTGECLPRNLTCDGVVDCSNDEINCPTPTPTPTTATPSTSRSRTPPVTTPALDTATPLIITPSATPSLPTVSPTIISPCADVICTPLVRPTLSRGEVAQLVRGVHECCEEYIVICRPELCYTTSNIACVKPMALNRINIQECCAQFECVCPSICPKPVMPNCAVGSSVIEIAIDCNCTEYACVVSTPTPITPTGITGSTTPTSVVITPAPGVCRYVTRQGDTHIYKPGETWIDGLCKSCTCSNVTGVIAEIDCQEQTCSLCRQGERLVPRPGVCCGECRQAGCFVNGRVYQANEIIPGADACFEQTCVHLPSSNIYLIQRTTVQCPRIEQLPLCQPGQPMYDACCPQCVNATIVTNDTMSGICVTCSPRLVFGDPNKSLGFFRVTKDGVVCVNKVIIPDLRECSGYCDSVSRYRNMMTGFTNDCNCCQPSTQLTKSVKLSCTDGRTLTRTYRTPTACACSPCTGGR